MKNIIIVVSIFFLLALAGVFAVNNFTSLNLDNGFTYSFCDSPIHYRIDTVDSNFNLSREAFASDISQAVQIWDGAINKNLFVYDPKGDLSINLIYDERQSLTTQISQLENKVQTDRQSLNPQVNEYQKLSAEFKQKIDDLNKEIANWNSKGGAPPEIYQQLASKQRELQVEADTLNSLARSLNISAQTYNAQVSRLNQTISNYNSALEERPEEGVFKGAENRIEIYLNINRNELIHTIAHELGHALGVGHVENKDAIMYSKTSQSVKLSAEDIAVLNDVCKRYSIPELFRMGFAQFIKRYKLEIPFLGTF